MGFNLAFKGLIAYRSYIQASSCLQPQTHFSFRQLVFPFTLDPICKGTLLSAFCDLFTSEQLTECCYFVYIWPSEFKKYSTVFFIFFLTVHLRIILLGNQLDAQFLL